MGGVTMATNSEFIIENNVLKKYNGNETTVIIPNEVKSIGIICVKPR